MLLMRGLDEAKFFQPEYFFEGESNLSIFSTDDIFFPLKISLPIVLQQKNGAGEGIRTLDPDLGKVVLYP